MLIDVDMFIGVNARAPIVLAVTAEGGHSMNWPEGWSCRGAWAPRLLVEWVLAVAGSAQVRVQKT